MSFEIRIFRNSQPDYDDSFFYKFMMFFFLEICTVYKEGDVQYNNIVLIIDHEKIVDMMEDIVHSSIPLQVMHYVFLPRPARGHALRHPDHYFYSLAGHAPCLPHWTLFLHSQCLTQYYYIRINNLL